MGVKYVGRAAATSMTALHKPLTALVAATLLAGLAGAALAQGGSPGGPGGNADPPSDQAPANATERQAAAKERHEALQAARAAILDGFAANRSAILAEYRASLNATRAAFLDAKAEVLADCAEAREGFTNNTGSTESPEHAKCVADGLRPLAEQARADNKAARDLAISKLRAERDAGLSQWAKSLREANGHYQVRTGEAPAGA